MNAAPAFCPFTWVLSLLFPLLVGIVMIMAVSDLSRGSCSFSIPSSHPVFTLRLMLHFGVFHPKNPAASHCWGFTETVTSVKGQTIKDRAATPPTMPRNCPVSLGIPLGGKVPSGGVAPPSPAALCVSLTRTHSHPEQQWDPHN